MITDDDDEGGEDNDDDGEGGVSVVALRKLWHMRQDRTRQDVNVIEMTFSKLNFWSLQSLN